MSIFEWIVYSLLWWLLTSVVAITLFSGSFLIGDWLEARRAKRKQGF